MPVDVDINWGIPEDEHVAVAERLGDETAELVDKSDVIEDHDVLDLRADHSACQCEIVEVSSDADARRELRKDDFNVFVEGLRIALDCDKCTAFTEQDTRPDIIAVQACETPLWLILEMKTTMRPHAAEQAEAALERLGQDPALFDPSEAC